MADEKKPAGPDLTKGVPFSSIADGASLLGHVGDEAVLVVRQGAEVFAIGPECTHYHGPLAEGVVTDGTVRCPWHHACFDLRTGEALHAPALSPVACWKVERQGDTITVREKMEQPKPRPRGKASAAPNRIVIVGGGAAGFAAAEMLRRQGYRNAITMLATTTRRRSIARTSRRIISPAMRPRIGSRSARTPSTRRTTSICGSTPRSARST